MQDWAWVDLFSKREDGGARPGRGDRRPSVTEVSSHLLVGEYPAVEDIAWLKENFDVTAVHNLQDDYDLSHNGLDIEQLRRAYAALSDQAGAHSDFGRQRRQYG